MLKEIRISFTNLMSEYASKNPWTNVYGIARSIMALGLLLTLLSTRSDALFIFGDTVSHLKGVSLWIDDINFFLLFADNIFLGKILACFILMLVISGIVPQITGILHWWVAVSFVSCSPLIEGGDQLNAIIAFFLIPVCISDNRLCHWFKPKERESKNIRLIAWSCFFIISIQVSIVYFHAAIAKFDVEEWVNGTSVYYWATHNVYGVNDNLKDFIFDILGNKYIIVAITWGTILFEIILASWIWMSRNKWNWKLLFIMAVSFHFFIIIFHGLASFFISMLGALILYMFPKDKIVKIW